MFKYFNFTVLVTFIVGLIFTQYKTIAPHINHHQSIKFRDDLQSFTTEGKVFSLPDSVNIFFHEDHIVYQRPYIHSYSQGTMDKDHNIIEEREVRVDTLHNYFIYKNKNTYGYLFDSLDALKPQKMHIDTFKAHALLQGYVFYWRDLNTLVESSSSNNILFEKYIGKKKYDDTYPDSIYYYFDKRLVNVDYTFSHELDSIKHSKLFKVRMIFNKRPAGQKYYGKVCPFVIPRLEDCFEISRNTYPESPELTKFINLFISKESTLYKDN